MCPLTDYGQEQNKEKIFHGHFWGGVKDLVGGVTPTGLLVLTVGATVEVAGLGAGVVAGTGAGDLPAGAVREGAFF